ncbi:MAG: M67 family metallopeptidase [Anaerolineae bacterium]|nr:M67 family metallopeptidase [Thermoflexales bacterium]MDW8408754.1 M67 family metallopeptidase [Anaerolineae bacterium]
MLVLTRELMRRLCAHLEAGYPREACGMLIGNMNGAPPHMHKIARDVYLAPNVWSVENEHEGQRNRYLIAPDDYVRADSEATRRGLDIIGFFHSHPDHPARPSETDREYALPVISFVIVSVQQGRAGDVRSWVLRDDRSAFDEEPLTVIDGTVPAALR